MFVRIKLIAVSEPQGMYLSNEYNKRVQEYEYKYRTHIQIETERVYNGWWLSIKDVEYMFSFLSNKKNFSNDLKLV